MRIHGVCGAAADHGRMDDAYNTIMIVINTVKRGGREGLSNYILYYIEK